MSRSTGLPGARTASRTASVAAGIATASARTTTATTIGTSRAAGLTARALGRVLESLGPGRPSSTADAVLRQFLAAHPDAGRQDRRRIGDAVFDVLRNLRWLQHLATGQGLDPADPQVLLDLQARATRSAVDETVAVDAEVDGSGRHVVGRADGETSSPAVRHSLPDWLWDDIEASFGRTRAERLARDLLVPAPVQLRVNLARARPQAVIRALADDGIVARPIAGLKEGLVIDGRPSLEATSAFRAGHFEVQDAGSQAMVDFCPVRRGQTLVDFCAGGGGKTLALGARLRGTGRMLAFDVDAARLAAIGPRLARAGLTNVQTIRLDGESDPRLARYHGRIDGVLVDAPCSGTGTLRRHPDVKWRVTGADVAGHVASQRRIVAAAARLVAPGGWLVYGTCSVLRAENDEIVEWVTAHLAETGQAWELLGTAHWIPELPDQDRGAFFGAKWHLKGSI